MVVVLVAEAAGRMKTDVLLASTWLVGAILSFCHSAGALATFHHGSQITAFRSTAQQTQDLIGIRIGEGLFVNYAFVMVWLIDAMICIVAPRRYHKLPQAYFYIVKCFLVFIAINGAIVFQGGWTRWIGILCVLIWIVVWKNRNASAIQV